MIMECAINKMHFRVKTAYFYHQGYKALTISCLMREELLKVSIVGAVIFIRKYMYKKKNSMTRTPGSGCLSEVTTDMKTMSEE